MPIFFEDQEPQHVGTVLEDRERNYHDDSDFYALVWAGCAAMRPAPWLRLSAAS